MQGCAGRQPPELRRRETRQLAELTSEVRLIAVALDPQVTPTTLRTLEERVADQMAPQKLGGTVLGALGLIAVLLTMLGTYVLADSMTTMRMREMGIRAALGATRWQLGSIVLGETVRLIGVGIVAGLVLAWLGARTIRAFLFQVQPLDPVTLGSVAGTVLLLAVVVSPFARRSAPHALTWLPY